MSDGNFEGITNIVVDNLIKDHHAVAIEKGWYTPEEEADIFDTICKKLLLTIGELSEATEEIRAGHPFDEVYYKDGKPEGFLVELADAQIRINDMVGLLQRLGHVKKSFAAVMAEKHAYNKTRPARHGGKKV